MDVVMVNLGQRIAALDDGTVFPLTNLFDGDGDETDDEDEAIVAVGHLPSDGWVTIDLRDFEAPEHVH